jgi:hypothetical protein
LEQLGEWKNGREVESYVYDLVFNLGEIRVGVSEWEDRKSKKIVVPTSIGSQTIHHGVNRNLKHITVIKCIAASLEHVI